MLSGEELQEGVGKRLESDWISENFQFGLIHEVGEEHHIEDFQVVIKVFVDTIMNKNQNKLKNKYKNSSLRNQNKKKTSFHPTVPLLHLPRTSSISCQKLDNFGPSGNRARLPLRVNVTHLTWPTILLIWLYHGPRTKPMEFSSKTTRASHPPYKRGNPQLFMTALGPGSGSRRSVPRREEGGRGWWLKLFLPLCKHCFVWWNCRRGVHGCTEEEDILVG